jgi:hypothetical protein
VGVCVSERERERERESTGWGNLAVHEEVVGRRQAERQPIQTQLENWEHLKPIQHDHKCQRGDRRGSEPPVSLSRL